MRKISNDLDCVFEKSKWVSITGLCNNNCLFCLDGNRKDRYHKSSVEIKPKISEAKREGCTKLILSGGDPTIHPEIIELVRFAKDLKFRKVQIITNGRMFSNKQFTRRIISAGLDEVTFSIHGHNSEIHDYLTRVDGSFRQSIIGIRNVQNSKKNMIVNTDTCITGKNFFLLPKTIRFIVSYLGINEINLMTMVPEGNSWKNKEDMMCDFEKSAPYVRKVVDFCLEKNFVLWLSRFPPEYLEGYESFIEDPYKRIDDVEARIDFLRNTTEPECKGEKCSYCILNCICEKLLGINDPALLDEGNSSGLKGQGNVCNYDCEITIDKKNYKILSKLISKNGKTLLRLHPPVKRLRKYKEIVPKMEVLLPYLKEIDDENVFIKGIPPCILDRGEIKKINYVAEDGINYGDYLKDGIKDYYGLAEDLAIGMKIKKKSCESCINFGRCEGIFLNYIRLYGFGELGY